MLDAQSALQNLLNAISLHPRHNFKSKVAFKHLMMCFTAIEYGGLAFDMNWLTVLTANAILALKAIISCMRDPTMALYEPSFISFCTYILKFLIQKF